MTRLRTIGVGLFLLMSAFHLCPAVYADLRPVQKVIMQSDIHDPTCVHAADLDGDGDLDILSASWGEVAWYENDGSGQFGPRHVITREAAGASSIYVADLDGDGDLDVLSASEDDDKIAWYENE